jgi:hypothetical protein
MTNNNNNINRKPLTGGGAQVLFVIIRTDAKFTQLGFMLWASANLGQPELTP